MELVTVLCSNHFSLDEYIKQYLLQPDLPFISFIKIGLRYYILGDLILQLDELKNHLKNVDFCLFQEVFGKFKQHKP